MNHRLVLPLFSSVLACHGDDETDAHPDDVCRLVELEYTNLKFGGAYRWDYGYDDRGNRIEEAYDATTDGLVDSRTTTTYDESDRVLTVDVDNPAGGLIEEHTSYAWSDDGTEAVVDMDAGVDGKIETRLTNTYDSTGHLRESLTDYYPNDDTKKDDGVDRRDTYAYDDAGDLVRWVYDEAADDKIEAQTTCTYDSDDRLSTWQLVWTGGSLEPPAELTYDADDNVATVDWQGLRTVYSYDDDGLLLETNQYSGEVLWVHVGYRGPGVSRSLCSFDRFDVSIDAKVGNRVCGDGCVIIAETDLSGDGSVEERTTSTYECG